MPPLCSEERVTYSGLADIAVLVVEFAHGESVAAVPLPVGPHLHSVAEPENTVADHDLSNSVSDCQQVEKNADLPMAQNCLPGPISR
jgi:hypothetical protein